MLFGSNIDFTIIYLPMEEVDFGYKLLDKLSRTMISSTALKDIYERCHSFFKTCCKEPFNQIPPNFESLKKIKTFHSIFFLIQLVLL